MKPKVFWKIFYIWSIIMGGIGVFIISFFVLFIIFLICRELMCWYFKINKLVVLIEEQNNLLKYLLGKNNIEKNINTELHYNNEIKINTELQDNNIYIYKSIDSINIREKPDLESKYIFKLLYNETVSVIEEGENISNNNKWVCIKTKEGKEGWCYSNNLNKIN